MITRDVRKVFEKELGPFTFAMFMRASRTTLGLSQAEMARRLKITRGALCGIEKGRTYVTPEVAAKYAKRAGFSEIVAVEICLQDQLRRAKLNLRVRVELAA